LPLKSKGRCLIKLRREGYNNIKEFLEDVFYRDSNLAKYSYELLRMIYDRKELGLQAKNWKEHIADVFDVRPLTEEESAELKKLYAHTKSPANIKKPYLTLLRRSQRGEIELHGPEQELLKKAIAWNSFVSTYYSILNKFVAIGLVDKKEGKYVKSNTLLNQFKSIEKTITDFEVAIRS
jgi:hypothetical protein